MARTGVKTNADVRVEIARLNEGQLLKLHVAVSREAASRHLTLSVGELGERLVIELFQTRPDLPVLVASPRGTKNVDALSRDGERYSIQLTQSLKSCPARRVQRANPYSRSRMAWLHPQSRSHFK
jgi:hypothetical protein